ncbi:MAG TPA: [FeFe] hydrogenase H-cluster radical SAM maturase HydE [Bacteroidales bacterium]
MNKIKSILAEERFNQETLVELLGANQEESALIFNKSAEIKAKYIGNKVHLRGLIELSNICLKNCYYCGIRRGNKQTERYAISDEEVEQAIRFAIEKNLGSIVIQSGELISGQFISRVENILQKSKELSGGKLGITLSCGEQKAETYQRWFNAGAHRYLLRIESSNRDLYYKIHPNDAAHDFDKRLLALQNLQKVGFQTGTGVMIGLPFQTLENLAGDLLFMRDMDIDMCGMGPYVEHEQTPLFQYKNILLPKNERVELSLKMIALLRIMMKNINIASTTALQSLAVDGRERALKAGANIMMPNITPGIYRNKYALYENKPGTSEEAEDSRINLEQLAERAGCQVSYGDWGDSRHFAEKID